MYESKFLNNNKKKKDSILLKIINKLLICSIIVITTLILSKSNTSISNYIDNNFKFGYIRNLYDKYFNNKKDIKVEPVFNEKFTYLNKEKYKDGYKLEVSNNYLVPNIKSGVVTYIGDTDYGKSIEINCVDGVSIIYGNIDNIKYKIYDYIEEFNYLGNTLDNNLYIVIKKDNQYLDIDEYLKEN